MRQAHAFLQSLIDTVPDGVRVIDEDYQVVMVNRIYCEQMRTEPADVLGTPCYQAQGREEPCPPSLITCPFHATPPEGGLLKYMHRHVPSKESELYVEITAATLYAHFEGRPQKLIVEAIRDIAQQVKYSQEQRLSELGQLATGVAHEIYNPLASVRLGLQSILKRLNKAEPDLHDVYPYLKTVDGEMDKCITVTKRLLNLGHPPSQRPQLVNFNEIVPEVLSLLRFEALKNNVTVKSNFSEHDLRVLTTDSEMRMLVLNLAQNAFHAMPNGGYLTVSGRLEDGMVLIDVMDDGIGIRPNDIARIYDPFFSRRADGVDGTGLGLTISQAIVKRYKGELRVKSSVGEGTVFTVALPAADRALN